MNSIRTIIARGTNRTGAAISLVHRTAGIEIAGAGTRPASEGWAYLWRLKDGTNGGQWFATESEARARFDAFNVVTVLVHGEPVTLTPETIAATRQWYADNARQCIADAVEGRQRVNDLDAYVAWREQAITDSLAGRGDTSFAFLQRAVAHQTGECVPMLAR